MAEILTSEQIDTIIRDEHHRLSWKTCKNKAQKNNSWDEDIVALRRRVIMEMLGKGKTKMSISKELGTRWDISESTAYNYIKDAMKYIAENYKEDYDKLKDILMHKLESLAEEATQARDRKSALRAYDQISKLAGLYTEKVEVQQDTNIHFDFGNN
jgi:transposase